MSNKNAGNTNNKGKTICGAGGSDPDWICSLAAGHTGNEHKGYWHHEVSKRTQLATEWYIWQETSPGRSKQDVTSDDDVAAAMASIQATLTSRMPPESVAARIAETNTALAEKYEGSGVSIQIHVQNNMKAELDAVIESLSRLRDSL